jgi:hypothetical protein
MDPNELRPQIRGDVVAISDPEYEVPGQSDRSIHDDGACSILVAHFGPRRSPFMRCAPISSEHRHRSQLRPMSFRPAWGKAQARFRT